MFNLKTWLSEANVDGLDESLSKLEAQLFVLSDSLLNETSGPILATVLLSVDNEHGLGALVDLAEQAELRMVMVAVSNLLYAVQRGHTCEYEFEIPADKEDSEEVVINGEDLPSTPLVKEKISLYFPRLVDRFQEMIQDGEFCCDSLTYLLALNIACSTEGAARTYIRQISTTSFVKTVMRSWLRPELYNHQTLIEGGNQYTLGFMVTCYLKSLIRLQHESSSQKTNECSEDEEYGLKALVKIANWASKYMVMRMYQRLDIQEVKYLLSVITSCVSISESFCKELLHASFIPALLHCLSTSKKKLNQDESPKTDSNVTLQNTALLEAANCLNTIADQILQSGSVPLNSDCTFLHDSNFLNSFIDIMTSVAIEYCSLIPTKDDNNVEIEQSMISICSVFANFLLNLWKLQILLYCDQANQSSREVKRCSKKQPRKLAELLSSMPFHDPTSFCYIPALDVKMLQLVRDALIGLWNEEDNIIQQTLIGDKIDSKLGQQHVSKRFESRCEWCFQVSNALKLCHSCQKVYYCCVEHQKLHWYRGHKAECTFLRQDRAFDEYGFHKICDYPIKTEPTLKEQKEHIDLFSFLSSKEQSDTWFLGMKLPGVYISIVDNSNPPCVVYATKCKAMEYIKKELCLGKSTVSKAVLLSLFQANNQGAILLLDCIQNHSCLVSLTSVGSKEVLQLSSKLQ